MIFKNKTKNSAKRIGLQSIAPASEAISSIVSKDMNIVGEIHFRGKAKIDGMIDGNVTGEHLILSETGSIQGDLTLTSLTCHGRINGNVIADSVTVHSNAAVQGKLTAGSLVVESGALLTGEISASDDKLIASDRPVKQLAEPAQAEEPAAGAKKKEK